MALGDTYATAAELKARLNITTDTYDDEIDDALDAVSRSIEKYCNRQFNDAGAASTRVYVPLHPCWLIVDDFHETEGLMVKSDEDGDGVYETEWAASDYQVEPLNGIVDGQPGWPYWVIHALKGRRFPDTKRAAVQVTARWGWAAVPGPVKSACLILAAETFKLREAPFGVASFQDFGLARVRDNPIARRKLNPYRRDVLAVA